LPAKLLQAGSSAAWETATPPSKTAFSRTNLASVSSALAAGGAGGGANGVEGAGACGGFRREAS
jgi:hypothetical protein